MNCQFDWCMVRLDGHTDHDLVNYVPVSGPSGGSSRPTLQIGVGVVVDAPPNDDARVFVHLNTDDDNTDEDAYMTADEAESIVREMAARVAIARNPDNPQANPDRQLPVNQVNGPVVTAEEAGQRLAPDEGAHTRLAHFVSGESEATVERYDYKMPDGSIDSEYELLANWHNDGCGLADFQLQREDWNHLGDMIAVLAAARRYTRELVAA